MAGEAEREAAVVIATAASPAPLPVQLDGKHRWSTVTDMDPVLPYRIRHFTQHAVVVHMRLRQHRNDRPHEGDRRIAAARPKAIRSNRARTSKAKRGLNCAHTYPSPDRASVRGKHDKSLLKSLPPDRRAMRLGGIAALGPRRGENVVRNSLADSDAARARRLQCRYDLHGFEDVPICAALAPIDKVLGSRRVYVEAHVIDPN
jgi:hypothetical protein